MAYAMAAEQQLLDLTEEMYALIHALDKFPAESADALKDGIIEE